MIDMSVHNFLDENYTSACDKNIFAKGQNRWTMHNPVQVFKLLA